MTEIEYKEIRDIDCDRIIALYKANAWSSAEKPEQLCKALLNAHTLISAWDGQTLVGLGNAISDGFLVVYYPHLLVLPSYQGRGIGCSIAKILMARYQNFHQQMLVADVKAIEFYRKCGFEQAGETVPMWIYHGREH